MVIDHNFKCCPLTTTAAKLIFGFTFYTGMSYTMKTNMNAPLTQGATWTGRAPRSEQQVSLWVLTFMVREAVLVAPDNMEKKESMYYFNGVYEHVVHISNLVLTLFYQHEMWFVEIRMGSHSRWTVRLDRRGPLHPV